MLSTIKSIYENQKEIELKNEPNEFAKDKFKELITLLADLTR